MIKIKIGKQEIDSKIKATLKIRKSLDGSLMVSDHEDIEIVIIPSGMKVLLLPKELLDDKTYDTQNRLMKELSRKGIIKPESIHSGNVYASLEAQIQETEGDVNPVDLALLVIARWIEEEKPHFMYQKASEEQEVDRLTDPEEDETTPLGQVPHRDRKGSIQPKVHPVSVQKAYLP